jgi:Tol biopolymer transport system component
MNLERWNQIEQIYYSVVASPLTSRSAILDALCSDDLAMRDEVESLLNAREEAGPFLTPDHFGDFEIESSLVGCTLGPYQILSAIGAGAMGEVYVARDSRLDRRVALKVLPPQFTRNAGRIARFQREAKAASALNHPNIMAIYDIGEIGETWFIAAEFIEGVTLRERLNTGKLSVTEAVDICIQSALALQAAHQAGVVHRDIKPENIMVRPDDVVKVVDFGLARIAAEQAAVPDATQAGTLLGTPRYMSPEQARGEKPDSRADIFSLGAVLYETVCGQRAFAGGTTAEVFAALLGSTPTPPSRCADGIPQALDSIVLKALEKDRDQRYQTMQQFATDLQRFDQQPRRAPSARKRSARSLRPGRLVLAVLAAAVALMVPVAWYLQFGRVGSRVDSATLSVVPLTSFEGFKDFGALSPDGTRIAFSWNGGEGDNSGKLERSIYTKTIGPDDPVRLTSGTRDDILPAWSPDGRYIAFCRTLIPITDVHRAEIYIVPASGGQERKIGEGRRGVSWSPDGKTLAIADKPEASGGIILVSLQTLRRRQMTSPRPYSDNLPVFSPDGRRIAFTRDFGYSAREIYVVPATGGRAQRLTFDREPTYGAAWTADSREIVFASNRGVGGESLWRVAANGGSPRRLSTTLEGGFSPSVSGKRLVYTQASKDTNIDAYAGPGFGSGSVPDRFGGPKALIHSSRRDDSPSISPDGKRIAFVSKRTGNEEIWTLALHGKHLKQLTSFRGPATGTPRWSPDGRWIAFDSLAAGNPDIYVIDANGGTPRRLTTGLSGNFMPSWSSDAQWLYFKSNRSGSDQMWKVPFGGGSPVQITKGGATEGFASSDGKLLYFTNRVWGTIWTIPVGGGPENIVPELAQYDRIFRSWGVIDRGIYFLSREDAPHQTIRFFSFATRRVTPLVTVDKEPIWDYPDVALSQDGRLMLFAYLDQDINDLMLIENFH